MVRTSHPPVVWRRALWDVSPRCFCARHPLDDGDLVPALLDCTLLDSTLATLLDSTLSTLL